MEIALSELKGFHRIIMNLPHDSFRYLDVALEHLRQGGILHYYEILDIEKLEERMEELRSRNMDLLHVKNCLRIAVDSMESAIMPSGNAQ